MVDRRVLVSKAGMKTLLILRHAKSSWSNMNLSDFERPLNARGKRDAPRMGKLLLQEELIPDLIITSSAERAFSTAEAVAMTIDYDGEIKYTRFLYHAPPEHYLTLLSEVSDEHSLVMVVGHNPGIEDLVMVMTSGWERMPTAALAKVKLPISHWAELTDETKGSLEAVWRPKEL